MDFLANHFIGIKLKEPNDPSTIKQETESSH
jgi:hypothetical protein